MDVIDSLLTALPVFLAQFAVALATLLIALAVVLHATPAAEVRLIREGNLAAAIWSAGTTVAMAMPIGAALRFSHTTAEVAVWAALAALIQIAAYYAASALFGKTRASVEAGELPSAVAVVGAQLGVAFINTAALSA